MEDFPILQTHLFLHVMITLVMQVTSPTRATLLRENFLQNRFVDSDAIHGYNTGRALQSELSLYMYTVCFIYTLSALEVCKS